MEINLIEIYSSVQGETSFTGLPTTFIRTAGCNLRCSWCDTTYSFGRGEPWKFEEIFNEVEAKGCQHVCLTGGEPLIHKEALPLVQELCNRGYTVSVETGGSLNIAEVDSRAHVILDIKCPDSGMSDRNHWQNLEHMRDKDEVKFVINGRNDFDWAVAVCEKHLLFSRKVPVLFSPVHDVLEPKELIGWILENKIPVRLNLQVHKYIWSPATLGV